MPCRRCQIVVSFDSSLLIESEDFLRFVWSLKKVERQEERLQKEKEIQGQALRIYVLLVLGVVALHLRPKPFYRALAFLARRILQTLNPNVSLVDPRQWHWN
jgi:hypothetical protein